MWPGDAVPDHSKMYIASLLGLTAIPPAIPPPVAICDSLRRWFTTSMRPIPMPLAVVSLNQTEFPSA
jgi:hypothetical protein